jgi:threonine synthase
MVVCTNCGISFSDARPLCPGCGAPTPDIYDDADEPEWLDEIEDADFGDDT